MHAMQGFNAQRALAECSSEAVDQGVYVSVTSAFVEVGPYTERPIHKPLIPVVVTQQSNVRHNVIERSKWHS